MPQKTVYIRDDDLEAWKSIEKKSEFIHQAILHQPFQIGPKVEKKSEPQPIRYARQGDIRKGEPPVVELGNSKDTYEDQIM